MPSYISGLECRTCRTTYPADQLIGVCPKCGQALLATYDLDRLRARGSPGEWRSRPGGLWRYRELMPVVREDGPLSLGEGETPTLRLASDDEDLGLDLWAKNDGGLPTGTFKAREMSVAISRAVELGARSVFLPSTGNAGVAAAAYAARAGIEAHVYLTDASSPEIGAACRAFGAEVRTVRGTMSDARRAALEQEPGRGGVDLSTMREPYRLEGTKSMAFELFDRFGPEGLPDAVVYPTGGGLGLVGMYKGFTELRALGWLEKVPRFFAVQTAECAPIVRALREDLPRADPWTGPVAFAGGLTVPAPFGSERVLEAVRGSGGSGIAVPVSEIRATERRIVRTSGLLTGVEGAAPFAALPHLVRERRIRPRERVLLYLTGSGLPLSLARLSREDAPVPALRAREGAETP